MRRIWLVMTAVWALAVGAAAGAAAAAECRLALALGLDVSGSVDAQEYRLQLDGLAGALQAEAVVAALTASGPPVRVMVYEWSGPRDQRVIAPWQSLTGPAEVAALAARLRAVRRVAGDPSTALGTAMATGARALRTEAGCWRQVLDISGDGASNTGPRPQDVGALGITVNALVVGAESGGVATGGDLVAYFERFVLRGPGAFVEQAAGFEDYEAAMVRKLLRETEAVVVGAAGGAAGGTAGGTALAR